MFLRPLCIQHQRSSSQLERIIQYIENQETHHHKLSFQEEFVMLLKKHNIEYDARYLWE